MSAPTANTDSKEASPSYFLIAWIVIKLLIVALLCRAGAGFLYSGF